MRARRRAEFSKKFFDFVKLSRIKKVPEGDNASLTAAARSGGALFL